MELSVLTISKAMLYSLYFLEKINARREMESNVCAVRRMLDLHMVME